MAELRIRPRTKQLELISRGWTEVVIKAPLSDECIKERNRWCRANITGPRGHLWDAVHLKYYYFAHKHHALMFKLALGGKA